jgi:hypothetical protein
MFIWVWSQIFFFAISLFLPLSTSILCKVSVWIVFILHICIRRLGLSSWVAGSFYVSVLGSRFILLWDLLWFFFGRGKLRCLLWLLRLLRWLLCFCNFVTTTKRVLSASNSPIKLVKQRYTYYKSLKSSSSSS